MWHILASGVVCFLKKNRCGDLVVPSNGHHIPLLPTHQGRRDRPSALAIGLPLHLRAICCGKCVARQKVPARLVIMSTLLFPVFTQVTLFEQKKKKT